MFIKRIERSVSLRTTFFGEVDILQAVEFCQFIDRCCGLDVHKKVIVATVEGTGIPRETREFSSTTRFLIELKEWLLELGVSHVAMESTGVY